MQLLSGERGNLGADEVLLDVLGRELNVPAPDTGWPRNMVDAESVSESGEEIRCFARGKAASETRSQ